MQKAPLLIQGQSAAAQPEALAETSHHAWSAAGTAAPLQPVNRDLLLSPGVGGAVQAWDDTDVVGALKMLCKQQEDNKADIAYYGSGAHHD